MRTYFAAVPAACFIIVLGAACTAEPVASVEPITAPATVDPDLSEETTAISSDPAEEIMIRGYIKTCRGLLEQGMVSRDVVTTQQIKEDLGYVNDQQAEAIRELILQ